MLRAENIHKSYGQLHVLKGVDLSLNSGEVVALVGSSGAGKSTLLQVLGTLDKLDKGKIFFNDKEISKYSAQDKARFRNRELGFVFQFHHLLPEFTALENVSIPAYIMGMGHSEAVEHANKLLVDFGLKDRATHKPSELSGGEQQRVAMARALINRPKLILADEPTGNLDTTNSQEMHRLMQVLAKDTGVGFLIATHNLILAEQCDRILHIKDGTFVL